MNPIDVNEGRQIVFLLNVAKDVIAMGEDGLCVCFLGRENTPLELLKLKRKYCVRTNKPKQWLYMRIAFPIDGAPHTPNNEI